MYIEITQFWTSPISKSAAMYFVLTQRGDTIAPIKTECLSPDLIKIRAIVLEFYGEKGSMKMVSLKYFLRDSDSRNQWWCQG